MQKEEFLEVGREKLRTLRFTEALRAYEAAIDLDASSADAWYGKGTALKGLGRYTEAIEAFERAESPGPRSWGARARFEIANCRVHLGALAQALADFAFALDGDPGLERVWHNRACVLLDLGRHEEAAQDFARAAALDPEDVRIALLQGHCLTQLGREADAKTCFARAEATHSLSDIARVWAEIGSDMLTNGKLGAAIDAYDRAAHMSPRWGIPWLGRGNALLKIGRNNDALAAFDRAIASNDEATLLGWVGKSELFAVQGRPGAARDAYARIVTVQPRSWGDHRAQGRAHRKLGQFDAALASLAKAHALERSDPAVLMEQAGCLEEWGRDAEATAVLEEAVVRFPTFAEGWRRLAHRMLAARDHARAVACAEKAVSLGDMSGQLRRTLGAALFELGQFDAAETCMEAITAEKPRSAEAWFGLALCRLRLAKRAEGLRALDRALALDPNMTDALQAKRQVLQEMGRMAEAESAAALALAHDSFTAEPQRTQEGLYRLQQALSLDPNNLLAGRTLGEVLLQADQFLEQAEERLARWTAAWPDDADAWGNRAMLLSKLGRSADATACYAQAVAADPRSARALRNASGDAFANERYEEALAFAERSLQIEGESSDAWFGVGSCCARLGRLPEAVKAFKQAVAIDPKDIRAWKDLTSCLLSLARNGEATQAWKRVLELDPSVDPAAGLFGSDSVPIPVPGTSGIYVLDKGSMAAEEERRGIALLARHDHRGAAEAFDAALRIDPEAAEVWVERGICAEVLEGSERAIDCFDRALKIDPELVRALYSKAVSLGRLNRHHEAIHINERVLAIHDTKGLSPDWDFVSACNNMGLSLLLVGELERALDCFDKVLTIERTTPGVWQEEARRAAEGKRRVNALAWPSG
jgi:tetratricopeptide (TPR) repeat protein